MLTQHRRKQTELAEYLGVSTALVSKWKHQERPIPAKYARRVAEFFNVPANELTYPPDAAVERVWEHVRTLSRKQRKALMQKMLKAM